METLKRSSCFQEKVFLQFVEVRLLKIVVSVNEERYQSKEYARQAATLICFAIFSVCILPLVPLHLLANIQTPHIFLAI